MKTYDLVVIGSGPGGQRAAIQAAKLGKTVAIIEKDRVGGSSLHTGTIPSKTMKDAASKLSVVKAELRQDCFRQLTERKDDVIASEEAVVEDQILRNQIEKISGIGFFKNENEIYIQDVGKSSKTIRSIQAEKIVLATGTRPRRPHTVKFDDKILVDSDSFLKVNQFPESFGVIGAGVIGCEYASIFSKLGIPVTIVDKRRELLRGIDQEIVEKLRSVLESQGVRFLLGQPFKDPYVKNGKVILPHCQDEYEFDLCLFCMGRSGNVESLRLKNAGLEANARGLIEVNESFQTQKPHIYAVGDLIGSPALAAAAFEQGRVAALHAFGVAKVQFPNLFPYGIYTIPEISSVGKEEADLQKENIPYVAGRASFKEIARGKILDDDEGFLKLLFHKESKRLLGVHVVGTQATELVHIGQVALSFDASLDHLLGLIFNYPTLAEAYKVACLSAANALNETYSESSELLES